MDLPCGSASSADNSLMLMNQETPAASKPVDDIKLPHARKRSRLQRTSQLCASLAAVFFVLVSALGAGFLYLQQNAVSVDFIRDRLIANIQSEFGGKAKVEIGHVRVGGGRGYFATQVVDLTVKGPNGDVIFSAPDAKVDLSPAALARFEIAVQRITLRNIDLAIDVSPQGTVSIANLGSGAQELKPAAEIAPSMLAILNGTLGVGGSPIPIVAIEDGRLQVNDQRRKTTFLLDKVAISADPTDDGRPAFKVSGQSPGGPLVARIAPGKEPLTFELFVDRISPADIGAMVGDDLKFLSANLPVSLKLLARVNEQAVPQSVQGEIRAGHGKLYIDDPDAKPIDIESAHVKFAYAAGDAIWNISELAFDSGGFAIQLAGSLSALDASNAVWKLRLAGTDGTIRALTPQDKPLLVSKLNLDATLYPAERKAVFDRLEMVGPQFGAAMKAEAVFDAAGRMALSLGLSLGRTESRAALHIWPAFVAADLRSYLVKNMKSGTLNKLSVATNISVETFQRMKERRPMPAESVAADFSVSDATLQLVDGLPPLSNLALQGRTTGLTTALIGMTATMSLASGKSLSLSEGTFDIADLGRKPVEVKSQFRLTGVADAVLELMAQPSMQGVLPQGGQPDSIKGQFDGQVGITLPLIEKLSPSSLAMQIKATLSNVIADHIFGKERFEANQLQLASQAGVVSLKGDGKIAGMNASVDFVQPRKNDAEDAIISITMDDAARAKRGFAFGQQLTGPIIIKIKSDFPASTKTGLPVEIDLSKAAIDGLLPGWTKSAGKPAKAKFSLMEKDGAYRLSNFELDGGGGPVVKGAMDVLADGNIGAFNFTTLKLSPGDNMQAEGQKTPNGLKITMKGNSFDARPFLRGPSKSSVSASSKEIELDIKAVALSGFNGEIASNGDVKLVRKGTQIRQGTIAGRLNGDMMNGKITPRPDGSSILTLQSQNAGALLRFMDIYNRMQGGRLEAQVSLTGAKEKGWFTVQNFDLRDEPALQRVAAAAAPADENTASTRPALVRNASDVNFTKMRVDFTRNGDLFDISEGVMWGREIGGTLTGMMDYGRDRINMSGTFVPAYGLNNAFARIPVVGLLLSGNKNEGLFAVPFRITGKASTPSVSVNPIAAVSPGFLRKIFDFQALPTAQVDPTLEEEVR